jgi:outer membrane protein assembly factor BamB
MTCRAWILTLIWAGSALGCHQLTARQIRTGGPEGEVAPVAVNVAWRVALSHHGFLTWKPQEFARAASDGERVFIASEEGVLYALRERDGETLWQTRLSGGSDAQALYDDQSGLVFVGADDGTMHAVDASTGTVKWRYRAKGALETQPTLHKGTLYFTTSEGRLYALEAETGKWRWQYERESPENFTIHGFAGVLVVGDRVYSGFADGYAVSLQAKDGSVVWARSLAQASEQFVDVDTTPTLSSGMLFAASYSGGLYALNPKDGAVKWRYEVEGAAGIAVAGGRVYFTAAKTGLHVLDKAGRLVWRQSLAAAGDLSPPSLVGSFLVLSGSDAGVFVVDRNAGELAALFNPGEGVSAMPLFDRGALYVLSNRGYFYKLELR